ncbi:hypothetical protein GGR57DRAFT_503006 [Xylariaceae sp. FL1272]|nr:hypothetical protein GGR57DRAFT_503006 [Xylariaceae sp. FL1272]
MAVSQHDTTSAGHNSKRYHKDNSVLLRMINITWGFIGSDLFTFALPNTMYGILGALAGSQLLEGPPPRVAEVMKRAPIVMLFNFYSLLLFDLAYQWPYESVKEDRVNKPWRPIPSGMITPEQTRQALLFIAITALALNYSLGIWHEGMLIQILSYYYNELRALKVLVLCTSRFCP